MLSFTIGGFTQQAIFNESKAGNITFTHHDEPSKKDINTNYIIKTIAAGLDKDIENTSYKFYYTANTKIVRGNNTESYGYINFKGFVFTGDVKFRDFSLTEVLVPSRCDASVKIITKTKIIKSFDNQGIHVNETNSEACFSIPDSLIHNEIDVEIDVMKFYYDEAGKSVFDEKILAINNYYKSETLLSEAKEKLKKIDLNNIDHIPLYNIWIDEVDEIIDDLEEQNLAEKINLSHYDPIRFVHRLDSLRTKTNEINSKLKNDLSKIESIYYEKAVDFIKQFRFDEAEKYLEKSLSFNTKYFPAHLMTAKMHLRRDETDAAVKITSKIFEEINLDKSEKMMFNELCEEIIQQNLKIAESLLLEDNDNDALEVLNKTKDFCKSIPGADCPSETDELIARAKYGIFKSYLHIAEKAMAIESYTFAESYLEKASEYQAANKESISSDAEITNLYGKLIYQSTEKGFAALAIPDFIAAQNYFDRAYRLCNKLEGFKCSQRLIDGINAANQGIAMEYNPENDTGQKSLSDNIKKTEELQSTTQKLKKEVYDQGDYKRLIAEGQILAEEKQTTEAYNKFLEAKELEPGSNITPDPELDNYIQNVVKPALLKKIKKAEFIVWKNELDSAQEIYEEIIYDKKRFKLEEDKDIENALTGLQKDIIEKNCFNIEAEYNNGCLKALREIRRANFQLARIDLQKTKKLKDDNQDCIFRDNCTEKIENRYKSYFVYKKHFDMAKSNAREKNYSEAISNYKKAKEIFIKNQIDTLGISYPAIHDFIAGYHDMDFAIYGAKYCIENGEYENCLSLLKILWLGGISARETKNIQVELAEKLATLDKNKEVSAESKISEYINIEDNWFKYFRKTYLKVIKLD